MKGWRGSAGGQSGCVKNDEGGSRWFVLRSAAEGFVGGDPG